MISINRIARTVLAAALVAGCGRSGEPQRSPAPAAARQPSAPPAGADAIGRPNRVLDARHFSDRRTRAAYAAARQFAAVLEGIYCYCHCRENLGHRALVECFESEHGAGCDICQTEALIAARMAAAGRTTGEIQRAIDAYYAG